MSRQRKAEADEFYAAVHPPAATADEKLIQRQALAGMLWSKQIYLLDVNRWLEGDNPKLPAAGVAQADAQQSLASPEFDAHSLDAGQVGVSRGLRPGTWHFSASRWRWSIRSLPRNNLWLLLFEQFQHPNGQIPAYEWEFSDLNPPVHAWACWRVYQMEKQRTGKGDRCVPGEMLPQAADEFRLVGEQGRQRRQQRF